MSTTGSLLGNRYRLTDQLASGGMGTVWIGTDERLQRAVAVKLLNEGLLQEPRFVERFRREAQAVAAFSHSNVAGVFDYGEDGGRPYIVMELVGGENVAQRLAREGRIAPSEAAWIGAQVADALAAAHAAGIVHRDVKPANVMLTPDGGVKVMDFGIAGPVRGGTGLTDAGMVMGTAEYLSPEQARGDAATPASDIYSLGVLLYEMLTGEPPFRHDTPVATAMAHLKEEPPPVRARAPDVPAGMASLVEAALAKDPNARPMSAAALAASLRQVTFGDAPAPPPVPVGAAAGGGAPATTAVLPAAKTASLPSHPATAPAAFGPPVPSPAARTSSGRRRNRSRRRAAFLVLGVLAAAALVTLVVLSTRSPETAVELPSFMGKTRGQMVSALHRLGLIPNFVEQQEGPNPKVVVGQDPPAGDEVAVGSTVTLYLAPAETSEEPAPTTPPPTAEPEEDGDEGDGNEGKGNGGGNGNGNGKAKGHDEDGGKGHD